MTGEPDIRVILSNDQKVNVDFDRLVAVATRTALLQGARGEISITLVDESLMADLHLKYMNEAGATDVLSFPVDGLQECSPSRSSPAARGQSSQKDPSHDGEPPPILIGEVVVCPAIAARAGPDLASEMDLLVAHGVLHLLGHDHDDGPGAQRMRAAEKRVTGRSGARAR